MSNSEIVGELFGALDAGNDDAARGCLDKNFMFSGLTPAALDGREFVAFVRSLRQAMPDLKIHAVATWEGPAGEVRGESRIGGTHRNALDLPFVPKVNATNRVVTLPTEHWTAYVRNGKVASLHSEVGADGGLPGLLVQLGREDLANCLRTKGIDCRAVDVGWPLMTHSL
jgi:hypothetical protein